MFATLGCPSGFHPTGIGSDPVPATNAFAAVPLGAAVEFEKHCEQIDAEWRSRLGRIRAGSSTDLLVRTLPGMPVVSVKSATAALGRSKPQVNEAVARLVDAGILRQVTVGRRNRAFEAIEIIDAFAALERRLASPEGDTHASPPARPVPARR